ncbi:MAG: dTMP kinase [Pseudomonadota bacterium]
MAKKGVTDPKLSGRFITIEGTEGAGKSTAIGALCGYLESQSRVVVRTREPGGTVVGEAIRRVLLSQDLPAMHADTELLLMFAARAEHLQKVIHPALNRGEWVVCDRFTDATYAYQGAGRGIPASRIGLLESWAQGDFRPDVTLLLDIDVETGLSRTKIRGAGDRFEQETLKFFDEVRQAYLDMAAREPNRFYVIDAAGTPEQINTQIIAGMEKLIAEF